RLLHPAVASIPAPPLARKRASLHLPGWTSAEACRSPPDFLQEVDLVPGSDAWHLRHVIRRLDLAVHLAEERLGVCRRIEDQHARRLGRGSLEPVHRAARRIDELA